MRYRITVIDKDGLTMAIQTVKECKCIHSICKGDFIVPIVHIKDEKIEQLSAEEQRQIEKILENDFVVNKRIFILDFVDLEVAYDGSIADWMEDYFLE